jgi:uncharacterized protein (DUF2062 family)
MSVPFKPVIVAPTYNNARMLPAVLEEIAVHGVPVIVVNDGCTDGTKAILAKWQEAVPYHGALACAGDAGLAGIAVSDVQAHQAPARGLWYGARDVVTHEVNRGKAEALRSGFRRATERGFTHAVTIDTDGQLDPSQIADLLHAARSHPNSLILGDRDMYALDYPQKNRIGRQVSNFAVWLESGLMVNDSQCGFRVYPLALVNALPCRSGRYGFETEVLTRAGWVGATVHHVTVSCRYEIPGGRISHLKPGKDTLHHIGMHLLLIGRSCLHFKVPRVDDPDRPRGTGTIFYRLWNWFSPWRAWRQVRDTETGRQQFAAALAMGVFIANLPVYGFQTLLSLYAARRFKMHPLPVVVGSHLSTPPVGPVLILAGIAVGHLMLRGEMPDLRHVQASNMGYWGSLLVEWIVGSVMVGGLLAGVAYLAVRTTLQFAGKRETIDPPTEPAASPLIEPRTK